MQDRLRNIPNIRNFDNSRRIPDGARSIPRWGSDRDSLRDLMNHPSGGLRPGDLGRWDFNRTNRPTYSKLQEFADQIRHGRVGKHGFSPGAELPNLSAPGGSSRIGLESLREKVRGEGKELLSARERFADRLDAGRLKPLVASQIGRKFQLDRQWDLLSSGDVSRRLNLAAAIHDRGGWRKWRHHGPFADSFVKLHFGGWYPGPGFYPRWCWYPRWSSWVNWSWWDYCYLGFDPRPYHYRPVIYHPCGPWMPWIYPIWQPLPVVACGTWVNVDPVVIHDGLDLQLLAVRFVDPGHPEQKLGPRYRVWFRNNSPLAIEQPFNVLLLAANGVESPAAGVLPSAEQPPEAGVRVERIDAGKVQAVDIRLPFAANQLGRNSKDRPIPFTHLHVLVDSHREIPEAFEENNGAVLAVEDILPVDPAVFAAESDTLAAGTLASIAGEGFGPEPGQVVLFVGGLELQAEIHGWYDLGVRFKIPDLPLATATDAEVVVIRGDGAVSNPLSITLTPPEAAHVPPPR